MLHFPRRNGSKVEATKGNSLFRSDHHLKQFASGNFTGLRIDSGRAEPRQAILSLRFEILASIKLGAELGYIAADASIGRLFNTYCDELAEDRRQLDGLEEALAAHIRRLEALFPPPADPAPVPPQGRRLGRISDALGRHARPTRH